jgi:DNA end-binding protein Ku
MAARARARAREPAPDADDEAAAPTQRPLWSGAVSFGIVAIAVQMFPAIREHGLHAHQISRGDRKRIRYLKVAEGGSDEVPAGDIVKGYLAPAGGYVTFTAEEMEKLAAERSARIDIAAFVELAAIDARLFDRPYYLAPGNDAAHKPFVLLIDALERSGKVGIARVVMHGKEHLAALRPLAGTLCVQTLHYADEILPAEAHALKGRAPAISAQESAMADQLVASLSAPFDAAAYPDEHLDRLRAAIQAKAKGGTLRIHESPDHADDGKVIDLVEALKRSLAEAKRKGPAKRLPPAPAPAPAHARKPGHAG